ncbi:type VI secretion system-associated FHA domain protein TagH [Serratia sp. M24T3]|uniref:type VI secretion system-associated FHA domain protein TagH n=1 Tax=Serratia sp. M24T3 TaxID=932213 RepID=UPI00025B9BF5|nr:type VI secretion system-associated FHA domain protein TagH [Serratia sp. M24T3]EIC84124.1 FHA domain-containing protein [Serratia sp. M24T3]
MRFTLVKSKNGVQPPQTSCDFAPPGGTIGRSEDNNFTLPDENRAISRLQALVHISAEGECRLTNRGNVINVEFNGIPLERGRQVELQDGDRLGIGDYLIEVSSLAQSAPKTDAALMSKSLKAVPASSRLSPAAAIPGEIWDSLADEFSTDNRAQTQAQAAADVQKAKNNPLTELQTQELNPVDPILQIENPAELHQLNKRETDPTRLFTADSPFEQEHILKNPTPSALLAQESSLKRPDSAQQELDPLALFGGAATSSDGNDLFGLMVDSGQPLTPPEHFQSIEPQAEPPKQPSVQHSQPLPTEALTRPDPQPPLPSEMRPEIQAHLARQAEQASRQRSPEPQQAYEPHSAPFTAEQPSSEAPVNPTFEPEEKLAPQPSLSAGRMGIDPVSYQRQPARQSDNSPHLDGNLLQGLLEGIGLSDMQNQPDFDAEKMRLLGQVVSLFSQGTVALLSSRSMLKRGVKAEMTMILDEANNPFKLLPSGKTVLMQMFGTQMPGFMQPEQAVRDALIDLQAHQLGMIAGIRAIIAAMLQSFNPELLETQAREAGQLPRMALSTKRKAALWDYFIKNYQKTSGEIEDDFHTLFGEAFLHAYDVEVEQYKDLQTKQGK